MPAVDAGTLAAVGIGVAAVAVRLWGLGAQSFWYDEALTVNLVHGSFGQMLAGVHDHEANPPLYYTVAWAWAHVFGTSEVALRSLSALFGVLTVPVAYLTGRELVNARAGAVAAALAALSPALVWYSQEARSYALMILLCGVALLFFTRALGQRDARPYALWALAVALALLTHYFSLFASIPEAIVLLVRAPNRRAAILATSGVAAVGLAIAPLALYQRVHGGASWIQTSALAPRLKHVAEYFLVGTAPERAVVGVGIVAASIAATVFVFRRGGARERRAIAILAALAAATVAIPVAWALVGSDYLLERNVMPAWLPTALVLGVAFGSRRTGVAGAAIAAVICLVLLRADYRVLTHADSQRDDWRGVAASLGGPANGRAITVAPAWQANVLGLYRPALRPMMGPARLSEVDQIVYRGTDPWHRRQVVLPPGPGFRPVRSWSIQRFTVVRYRAARPLLVGPRTLATGTSGVFTETR